MNEHSGVVVGVVVGAVVGVVVGVVVGRSVGFHPDAQSSSRMSTPSRHFEPRATGIGFDHSMLLQRAYQSVQLSETGSPAEETHRMNTDPSQLSTIHEFDRAKPFARTTDSISRWNRNISNNERKNDASCHSLRFVP